MYGLISKMTATPGRRDALAGILLEGAESIPGCLSYVVARDLLTIGLNWGSAMAFMALVGMPVIFGAFGFLCGVLVALADRGVGFVLDRMKR